jgi:spore coat polysaccharide biosynthesis protein SpsF
MILAIVQARMGSTRLPNKAMFKIKGIPVIEHVVRRVMGSKFIDKIVVATTMNRSDDVLEKYIKAKLKGCDVFRGSEENVLERFYLCAKRYKPEIIVRITADDPLKDPEIIDEAIKLIQKDGSIDYCSNTLKPSYPEGLDVEVFRFSALEKAYKEAKLDSEKEHVTPYIWKNPGKFKTQNYSYKEDLSKWRWTLDKTEDFEFMKAIYEEFYDKNPNFSYKSVINYLKNHPEIVGINSSIVRNEGYLRSLNKEKEK